MPSGPPDWTTRRRGGRTAPGASFTEGPEAAVLDQRRRSASQSMSSDNQRAIEESKAAVDRRDWDAAIRIYDAEVALDMSRMPGGGRYRGHDGVLEFFTSWFGA